MEVKKTLACVETPQRLEEMFKRFPSWYKLKKAVVWLRKFIRWMGDKRTPKEVTPQEMEQAEYYILKYVQECTYPKEREILQRNKDLPASSTIYKLKPMLYDGLLRVDGRLNHSALSETAKCPVILPKKHIVTDLIVKQVHEVEV